MKRKINTHVTIPVGTSTATAKEEEQDWRPGWDCGGGGWLNVCSKQQGELGDGYAFGHGCQTGIDDHGQ